jgi:hypothetical protein
MALPPSTSVRGGRLSIAPKKYTNTLRVQETKILTNGLEPVSSNPKTFIALAIGVIDLPNAEYFTSLQSSSYGEQRKRWNILLPKN